MKINYNLKIKSVETIDIRYPTSLQNDGSDAMHSDPDYSCSYVILTTDKGHQGHGMTFTLGRGTNIVCTAINTIKYLVEDESLDEILKNFGAYWRKLTSESQLRWLGPEKGILHLAVAAIINAIWDLWAKLEKVPVWRLLTQMDAEFLVSLIDFRYITDVLTKEEAIKLLKANESTKNERIKTLELQGYPCYTTQIGWFSYSDEKIQSLCKEYLQKGYTAFKVKVGQNVENDKRRLKLIRSEIGYENHLMVDANQVWDVQEAIDHMKQLIEFKLLWIEEPTSPDDILGHKKISDALKPYGIGVATGEVCANRVMFKQFLEIGALDYCQIDSGRLGGINEILSVYLMAKKLGIKVVPHGGGVCLCEMVQHLQMWDFVSLSATSEGKFIEYVDQQHDQLVNPVVMKNGNFMPPQAPGYGCEIKRESIDMFKYPNGSEWKRMFTEGIYKRETI